MNSENRSQTDGRAVIAPITIPAEVRAQVFELLTRANCPKAQESNLKLNMPDIDIVEDLHSHWCGELPDTDIMLAAVVEFRASHVYDGAILTPVNPPEHRAPFFGIYWCQKGRAPELFDVAGEVCMSAFHDAQTAEYERENIAKTRQFLFELGTYVVAPIPPGVRVFDHREGCEAVSIAHSPAVPADKPKPANLFEQMPEMRRGALAMIVNADPASSGFANTLRELPTMPAGFTIGDAARAYLRHMLTIIEKAGN